MSSESNILRCRCCAKPNIAYRSHWAVLYRKSTAYWFWVEHEISMYLDYAYIVVGLVGHWLHQQRQCLICKCTLIRFQADLGDLLKHLWGARNACAGGGDRASLWCYRVLRSHFSIKTSYYQYTYSHYEDNMVPCLSYLHNGFTNIWNDDFDVERSPSLFMRVFNVRRICFETKIRGRWPSITVSPAWNFRNYHLGVTSI